MKVLISSLFLAITANLALAFGPAPFRGGSPLATGTDGVYQAVATGTNLTGVMSWAISGGVQAASVAGNNKWVFFIDGNVASGSTVANISDGKITGVLDPGADFQIPVDSGQAPVLPFIRLLSNTVALGFFNGNINLKSPTGAFSGTGRVQGSPARTYQVLFIDEPQISNNQIVPPVFTETTTVQTVTTNLTTNTTVTTFTQTQSLPSFQTANTTGTIPATNFSFRGTRLSQFATAGVEAVPTAGSGASN